MKKIRQKAIDEFKELLNESESEDESENESES